MNVVVLGMHRSGTSAVTRLLGNLGFFIGTDEDLIPSNGANEVGYWERRDIIDLNKRLLDLHRIDWTAPQGYQPDRVSAADLSSFTDSAKGVFEQIQVHQPIVLKDPRFCMTINEWLPILGDVVFVVCVRHPIEVALSLKRRNRLSLPVGLALWEYYNSNIAMTVRDRPHLTVDYGALVANPPAMATKVARHLRDLGFSHVPEELTPAHYGHITQHLKHEQTDRGLAAQQTLRQRKLYKRIAEDRVSSLQPSDLDKEIAAEILDLLRLSRRLSSSIEANRNATNAKITKQVEMVDKLAELLGTYRDSLEQMRR
jgi:hypothetical protein